MVTLFIFLLIQCRVYSQTDDLFNKLIIGKEYKVYLFSEKEITGVLISQTAKDITLKKGSNYITIEKENIFDISADTSPSQYKFLATLNAGTLAGYRKDGNYSNFLINGRLQYFYSDNRNIGGDLSVIFLKQSDYSGDPNQTYSYRYETYIDLLANAQLGTFNVKSVIEFYLNLGFGLHSQYLSPYTNSYYSYYDSTYYYSNTPSSFTVYPMFQIGGGFIIKPWSNIGLNAEIDLKFYSFDYLIVPTEGYVPFNIGVTYFIF